MIIISILVAILSIIVSSKYISVCQGQQQLCLALACNRSAATRNSMVMLVSGNIRFVPQKQYQDNTASIKYIFHKQYQIGLSLPLTDQSVTDNTRSVSFRRYQIFQSLAIPDLSDTATTRSVCHRLYQIDLFQTIPDLSVSGNTRSVCHCH